MRYLVVSVIFFLAAACANAGVISDRSTLDGILGDEVTEDFESFSIANGSASYDPTATILNSSTFFKGQGPGLVVDGLDFTSQNGLQWNGKDYYGQSSKDILSYNQVLEINFWNPTPAFGFDLSVFNGYPDAAYVSVFGADKTTLLYSLSAFSVPDATPLFWGYSDSGGIGKVVLTGKNYFWGVLTDNVEFGTTTAVPEPVSTTLFLLGGATLAVRRLRRK